jgi:hypothetical protein
LVRLYCHVGLMAIFFTHIWFSFVCTSFFLQLSVQFYYHYHVTPRFYEPWEKWN